MIDDTIGEVIKSSGWEAGLLALIIISAVGLIGFIVKWQLKQSSDRENKIATEWSEREDALSTRIENLEAFVQTKLITALENSTSALNSAYKATAEITVVVRQLAEALNTRPCFWKKSEQEQLIQQMIAQVVMKVSGPNKTS